MKTQQKRPNGDPPNGVEMEKAAERLREIYTQKSGKNWVEARSLTEAEWEEIKLLIQKFSFPCGLYGAAYGFVFTVSDHGPMQGMRTDVLLAVENGEFPFPSCEKGFGGQLETLKTLEPITHRPRNAEVLEWYGFAPLSRIETYEY